MMNRKTLSRDVRRVLTVRSAAVATVLEQLEGRTLFAAGITPQGDAIGKNDLVHNTAATYTPASTYLFKRNGYLSGASNAAPLDVALNYVRANAASLGLSVADIGSPVVTDNYTDTDGGMSHVYLRQQINGLEVGNAEMNVNITHDGRVLSVGSTFVGGIANLVGNNVTPGIGGLSALAKAASNLGLTLTKQPQLASNPIGTAQTQTIAASEISTDVIPAHLRYVAVEGGGVELAWQFVLNVPGGQHWFDTSVSASTGKMRFTADWVDSDALDTSGGTTTINGSTTGKTSTTKTTTTSTATNAGKSTPAAPSSLTSASPSGGSTSTAKPSAITNGKETQTASYNAAYNVYAYPKVSPDSGPRTIVTNPWDIVSSPYGWQDTNGDAAAESTTTVGNNVSAQDDTDNNNTGGNHPAATTNAGTLTWDFPIDLTQAPSTYQSAAITNLYYWNNLLHDIHFRYGFTEAAGNFQQLNYTGTGTGNDRVQADAQDGGGLNNANFSTPADGSSGRMQMYLWNFTALQRDGDLDASVMIHEYGHGVSNRLTGGPANSSALNSVQSGGMGEGWSDWWALMFTQTSGATSSTDSIGEATYVAGQDSTGPGLRRWPYSYNKNADPKTFDLYNSESEVHRTGELWTTVLWDMAVTLEKKYGFNSNITQGYTTSAGSGNLLALRLVMDGLKLQPVNPSFTQARDAILQADTALTGGLNQREIYTAFARRGLGVSAVDASSSALSITPAFDIPANLGNATVTHATPLGTTKLTTLSSFTFQFNEPMAPASFSTTADVTFTGPGGTSLAGAITGGTFSNGNKTLVISFTPQSTDGAYTMKIGPNIQSADTGANMDQDLNGTSGQGTDSFTVTTTLDTTPGPDGGGYEASLVASPGGSIAATGTTILDSQDDTAGTISLGANTFRFYGNNYNSVSLNENGLITLGGTSTSYLNGNLETGALATIAPLWDDLATDGAGADKVVYTLSGTQLVIEWSNIHARGDFTSNFSTATETFQAILSLNSGTNNGGIVFNYIDLDLGANRYSNGQSATVGLKGAGNNGPGYPGTQRLLLSEDGATDSWLNSGVAVQIGQTTSSATVSGKAFVDRDADGAQTGAEPVLAGVLVFDDANNNSTADAGEAQATTDSLGNYTLANLAPGAHNIRWSLAGYVPTNPSAGAVTLTSGQTLSNTALGLFPITYAGSAANDAFTLGLNVGATRYLITSAAVNYSAPIALLASSSLTFSGAGGNDTLTIDESNGVPIPVSITFDGGAQAAAGADTLVVNGSTAADTVVFANGSATLGAKSVTEIGLEAVTFDGKLGGDNVTINGGPIVTFPASQRFASLNIAAAGSAAVATNGNLSIVVTNSFSDSGLLDLKNNDMIVKAAASTLATVAGKIKSAYDFGNWDGLGITSTAARDNPNSNTALGSLSGDEYANNNGSPAFDGEPIAGGDVLVKYTYFGDVDFNGAVDSTDYNLIDFGFLTNASGWANGDVDYSGAVDSTDYNLIDFAFVSQTGAL